jgi:hypothetical protein
LAKFPHSDNPGTVYQAESCLSGQCIVQIAIWKYVLY